MHQLIEEILTDNSPLLTPAEQKALRQRLTLAANTQEALEAEMESLHGAYNQTNALIISLLVRLEQLENILVDNKIPLPSGPDYTHLRARIAAENRRNLYPALLQALRIVGNQLEAAQERERIHGETVELFKDLVETQKQYLAETLTALTRTRHDKDELKALQAAPAPSVPEADICRSDNDASLPAAELKEARRVLGAKCKDEGLVEQVIYLCHHAVEADKLVTQTVNPLRQNPRTGLGGLSKRAWARVIRLSREDLTGFGSSTLQGLL